MAARRTRSDASRIAELKAVCYAGLDGRSFRESLVQRISEYLRADAAAFAILDPDTGFLSDTVTVGCTEGHWEAFAARAYLRSPAADPARLAAGEKRVHRAEELAQTADWRRDPAMEVLLASGFRYEVQVSLAAGGRGWGHLVFDRKASGRPFDSRELDRLATLVPHLLAGVRASLAREALAGTPGSEVGVITVGPDGRVELANGVAERILLGAVTFGGMGGFSALKLMVALLAQSLNGERPGLVPAVNVVDRPSGRRYRLSAERVRAGDGSPRCLVLIQPARATRPAEAFAQHGLTAREADVALAVLRGRKTKQIAAELRISPHTVSHHLRHVFDKFGVGSRAQLAAQLLGLPRQASQHAPATPTTPESPSARAPE